MVSNDAIRFVGAYSTPIEERRALMPMLEDVGAFALMALNQEEVFSFFKK